MSLHLPSESKADYSSYVQPDRLKVDIGNNSANFCTKCTYLIQVVGEGALKG